jgi:predicted nucleic acid-binding protein
VGAFINDLRELAQVLVRLSKVDRSADFTDNFLLAMAEDAKADYLISGDKCHVMILERHGPCHIVTAGQLVTLLGLD